MPRRHLPRFERQDLKWLAVVLSLLVILAVLLAFSVPALVRFINSSLETRASPTANGPHRADCRMAFGRCQRDRWPPKMGLTLQLSL